MYSQQQLNAQMHNAYEQDQHIVKQGWLEINHIHTQSQINALLEKLQRLNVAQRQVAEIRYT